MNEKHMNTSQYKKIYIYQRESVYKMTPKKKETGSDGHIAGEK